MGDGVRALPLSNPHRGKSPNEIRRVTSGSQNGFGFRSEIVRTFPILFGSLCTCRAMAPAPKMLPNRGGTADRCASHVFQRGVDEPIWEGKWANRKKMSAASRLARELAATRLAIDG